MEYVGIRELKNKLTYYVGLTKRGFKVIVTERGSPVAILHGLDNIENTASVEEKLASLAKNGKVKLPKSFKLTPFKPVPTKGKSLSQIIIEERR